MFKDRLRINKETFQFLCQVLDQHIRKKNTQMNESIDVQTRVALILSRLATGNSLSMIGDLYKKAMSTTFVIVSQCCEAIKKHLLPHVIEKMTFENMKKKTTEFNFLQDIFYIIGAIDGSHIPIVALVKIHQSTIVVKDFTLYFTTNTGILILDEAIFTKKF